MNELIKVLLELMALLPPQVVNVAIVLYLIWFTNTHKKDHKEILKRLEEEELKSITVDQKMTDIYMLTLRGNIVNPHIPVSARLEMYDIYKARGGNSWVSKWVEDNLIGHSEDESTYGRRKTDE